MNYKRLFIPNSIVFITVVTKNRKPILIDNIDLLRKSFKTAQDKCPFKIIAIIINPDHFHMLIKPHNIELYPKIIGLIKSNFTKLSKLNYTLNNQNESNVWQRRYWEHTIIDEEDLYAHLDYIHYNSIKHYNIAPKDWKYSSFQKFVNNKFYDNNWCNFKDEHKINNLNFE